jgi:hypothetical protein
MTKYIKTVIAAALLLGGASIAQADHHGGHSKTNRVDKIKAKPAAKKAAPSEAKKRYAAAAKKIKEGVKTGKLTEKQAKEKLAALRKGAWGDRSKSRRPSREDITKKFDKNKDGKLDEKERAEARKSMAEWRKKAAAKRPSKEGEKKAESRKRGRRPGSDRSKGSRRGGRGKRPQ